MNKKLKSKKLNTDKGITLIALIITIIVLLILAVVAIQAVKGDGILAHAKNARDEYQEAQGNEATTLQEYEDYITEQSGNKPTGKETYQQAKVGEKVTGENNATINGEAPSANNPVIPVGFAPINMDDDEETGAQSAKWDAEGGPEVDKGLVIKGDDNNEFVWVPITTPIAAYGLGTDDYREPDVVTGVTPSESVDSASGTRYDAAERNLTKAGLTQDLDGDGKINAYDFKIQLTSEFNAMATSITKYEGFYVGRYEMSEENGKAQSKKGAESLYNKTSNNDWYGLYKKAKTYAPATDMNSSVTSEMIWGSEYDAMMSWMGDAANTTIEGRNIQRTTGTTPTDVINNVYDLYGNSLEWTQEAFGAYYRDGRGGGAEFNDSPNGTTRSLSDRVKLKHSLCVLRLALVTLCKVTIKMTPLGTLL